MASILASKRVLTLGFPYMAFARVHDQTCRHFASFQAIIRRVRLREGAYVVIAAMQEQHWFGNLLQAVEGI